MVIAPHSVNGYLQPCTRIVTKLPLVTGGFMELWRRRRMGGWMRVEVQGTVGEGNWSCLCAILCWRVVYVQRSDVTEGRWWYKGCRSDKADGGELVFTWPKQYYVWKPCLFHFLSVDALMFMFHQDEQGDVSYQPLVLVSLRQCLCESEVVLKMKPVPSPGVRRWRQGPATGPIQMKGWVYQCVVSTRINVYPFPW